MELRDAIIVFYKRRKLALLLVIIVVGGTYLWAYLQPVHFTTSISFAVNRVNKEQTSDYQFDGFYALQAADLFADTVVSWLQTPSVLVEIYGKAGIATDIGSLGTLTSRLKTKKYSAQNIVLTYTSSTKEEASRLATAITDVITNRTTNVNRTADDRALFEVQSAQPVIVQAKPNAVLLGVASVVVAIALVLFLIPFVDYVSAIPRG